MKKEAFSAAFLAAATLALSLAPGASANSEKRDQFVSCVQKNGGNLPALTTEQKTEKKDCWKDNSGDREKAKACVQALNLPKPDAKTQAAIKVCKANFKNSNQNS